MGRLQYIQQIDLGELSLDRLYQSIERRLVEIPNKIAWHLPTRLRKDNLRKLHSYKNRHLGQRCFIIANGPSLNSMDLSLLKNELSIGMNRIYLNESKMGFLPTYLVVSDVKVQIRQFYNELQNVATTTFINWNGRKFFRSANGIVYFHQTFRSEFSDDFAKGVWGGHSVTNVCIQLAYYMGFKQVILLGKDHNYIEQGVPGEFVVSTGEERNHFVEGYYQKGMKWKIPDYKGEELAYQMAKATFEKAGREIIDATVGGKLQVFKKVPFNNLFR
jgi:hypothetical protein